MEKLFCRFVAVNASKLFFFGKLKQKTEDNIMESSRELHVFFIGREFVYLISWMERQNSFNNSVCLFYSFRIDANLHFAIDIRNISLMVFFSYEIFILIYSRSFLFS